MFVVVYVFGLPTVLYLFAYCRVTDVEFAYRESLGLVLYLFGSCFSLGHELHRFWWKARAE